MTPVNNTWFLTPDVHGNDHKEIPVMELKTWERTPKIMFNSISLSASCERSTIDVLNAKNISLIGYNTGIHNVTKSEESRNNS